MYCSWRRFLASKFTVSANSHLYERWLQWCDLYISLSCLLVWCGYCCKLSACPELHTLCQLQKCLWLQLCCPIQRTTAAFTSAVCNVYGGSSCVLKSLWLPVECQTLRSIVIQNTNTELWLLGVHIRGHCRQWGLLISDLFWTPVFEDARLRTHSWKLFNCFELPCKWNMNVELSRYLSSFRFASRRYVTCDEVVMSNECKRSFL